MNVAVRYFTKSGNTAKVAEAIAKSAGAEAQLISEPVVTPVDILFLGGSVYAFGVDESIKTFIENLDASLIKAVSVFSTSAIVKSANPEMEKLLENKGIKVLRPGFYCRGSYIFMHKGRPNAQDLQDAAGFARKTIQKRAK